ncbi:MMPL family transporter [Mycolicibacterium rufum]|uniref:MMPL family transporter n=1 Tax=Mycolicibacterium rufum TaxID=318424 RepID=A0ABY3UIJ5_9MYCO|nr:MMPL family transporter [Mycolicibacterium rufum]KGI70680.1 membrane protein [Mycolicibacterium rufum]ULP39434.1 MMPL family transporter [Mycolicibacterium rufum]
MLHRIAVTAIAAPRRILALAALALAAGAVFGVPAASSLSAGGFQDPSAESARATTTLMETFERGGMQLVFAVTDPSGADSAAARAAGEDIVGRLRTTPEVVGVMSAWTAPPGAPGLISADGRSGLVVADLSGGEDDAPRTAQRLADEVAAAVEARHGGVAVLAGGSAMVYAQINGQTLRDVVLMESIAIPLTFLVLVWVFRGLPAAALPVAVGALAIVGSLSVLRLVAMVTPASIFALNLTTALGLALAVDYTLLIVSRFRDEMADGADREQALITTMVTAGRTVLFSALTVALSMAAMALFPMYFLTSFAYAGVATVALCALAAIVVTPAAIMALGPRLDAFDLHRLLGARTRQRPTDQMFWYRTTRLVIRRALPIGAATTVLLLALGAPFLQVAWGLPDDRVLPTSASSRQVGDLMRAQFPGNAEAALTVVVPDADGLTADAFTDYARRASTLPGVPAVDSPAGTFVDGIRVGPPATGSGLERGVAFLTVASSTTLFTPESDQQLEDVRALPGPGGRAVELTGIAAINADTLTSITARLPAVLGIVAAVTFVLLFLLTGSVVLPLKALVLNMLSLTAAFGALVWIFQDGNLGALGTTPTGTLVANMPVLLFCIAFGLSMDYEVFLLARIRELWLASGRTRADNDESVAVGLARTGRVVTAAALIMAISFGALIAAQVSFMRMFGLGLTLAVLIDATVVRMVLLPAMMHLMGRWNWWAPAPLARLHERIRPSHAG